MHLTTNSIVTILYLIVIRASVTYADIDNEFKINKLNLVWMKAQHSLGSSKLKSLKEDLLRHELDEISLKRLKSHNQDKDGVFETAVRKKLLSLLSKYAIERYIDDIHPISHKDEVKLTEGVGVSERDAQSKPIFRDAKLDKLWKKAEKSGFSQEQLMILHEEFESHQKKLDDHYDTSDAINLESKNRHENAIDSGEELEPKRKTPKRKELAVEKKARLASDIHQGLKEKHNELKEGYSKLHKKVVEKSVSEQEYEETPVNNLWAQAIQANFTDEELSLLREDLENYQVRLKKLKHFQNQLERGNIGSPSKESKSYHEDDHETKHVRKRVEELTQHVDKTHKAIEQMIRSRGEEL